MENLPVHVFKDSFGPFIALLNEHHVKYKMRAARSGIQASSGVIEILQSTDWWPLAAVIFAFLKYRPSRKFIITTKDNAILHLQAEGYSPEELTKVLPQAKSLTAIETEKDETREEPPKGGKKTTR